MKSLRVPNKTVDADQNQKQKNKRKEKQNWNKKLYSDGFMGRQELQTRIPSNKFIACIH
jgi:hypothetical protein